MFRSQSQHPKPNRKAVNRRKKTSQHLLEVNVRAGRAKSQRNQRLVLFGCKCLLVVSLIMGVAYGVREALARMFFANPTYAVAHIEIQIDGTLSREQILKSAGLHEGVNIFSVKLAATRDALLNIPQVAEVEIQRQLPDTLKLVIHERHPVAWLVSDRDLADNIDPREALMLDAAGVVLQCRATLPEYTRLPILAGYPCEGLRVGKPVDSPELTAALSLLSKTSETLAGRYDIQLIDLAKGYCMEAVDREHTTVRFAFEDLDRQIQRLGLLLNYCDNTNQKMETVNLMVQRNVPVTFVRVETTELTPPGKSNPEGVKKSNEPQPVKKDQSAPTTRKRRTSNG